MTDLVSRPITHTRQHPYGYSYAGDALRYVAMPLGGIGAGQIALGVMVVLDSGRSSIKSTIKALCLIVFLRSA